MHKTYRSALALLAAAGFLALAAPAPAQWTTLTCQFDGTVDGTVTGPFVGTGVFSYVQTSGLQLADGTYDWDSFESFTLEITIGGLTFTHIEMTTSSFEINVEIRGSSFYFSNDNFPGSGSFNGSIDFTALDGSYLSTEPFTPNAGPSNGTRPLYFANVNGVDFSGTYGAVSTVPEPSTFAFMIAGAVVCGAVAHVGRGKAKRSV